jgi:bifunctional non-homologous end joining protein LigD
VPKGSSGERLEQYRKKRHFDRTPEPSGDESPPSSGEGLRFVIQKHDASHLHYDLRLEMEGVMRSWAVPKGPSLDPKVRRLAMEVEDHPVSYNEFEGTIPAGEYGGGTVMLWDHGTYHPDEAKKGESAEKAALRGYKEGKLSITFAGERLGGSFALVRTNTVEGGVRSKWLFLKHRDEYADTGTDITEVVTTSVVSGRTMEEIAAGKGGKRVWHSNRAGKKSPRATRAPAEKSEPPKAADDFLPMLATASDAIPRSGNWTFEPKFDGIRVLAFAGASSVALVTRNGNQKAGQFPEIVRGLEELVQAIGKPFVLDGEIVPVTGGKVGRFEQLQGRMHVQSSTRVSALAAETPAALFAFDLLLIGKKVLVQQPWTERRDELEGFLEERETDVIRLVETTPDPDALVERGAKEGWEGVIAKRVESRYKPGQRSSDWLKIKLENRQELVVGGWTEPRKSRPYMGAILLGYFDPEGEFVYAGNAGTGFTRDTLEDLYNRLKRLERKKSPFNGPVKATEKIHWVAPQVVVQVKFNEWTREGKLRQPVFLGVRDDKDPSLVRRETPATTASRLLGADEGIPDKTAGKEAKASAPESPLSRKIQQLRQKGGEGELKVGKEGSIPITSLGKVFYPATKHTKGDLLVYYGRMGDYILPWMKDRPLVLKRFPNGVEGQSFYQQAAPDAPPPGVRVETLRYEGKDQRRLVGGNLVTLLYTIQLGAISYDPWHSRITSLETPDYTILDLDPGPGVTFQEVVQVACWVKEEMDRLGLHGGLKTSGSSGLHIYLPLPRRTPLDAATLVAQIVATRVAQRYPKQATVERMTKNRPAGTVYVDYLQNILGKTVAGVYAVRAKTAPTVSTPLAWEELTDSLDHQEFTIDTVPARLQAVGDLWTPAMEKPNSLEGLKSQR